jgi:cytoskeletal protein RodZ
MLLTGAEGDITPQPVKLPTIKSAAHFGRCLMFAHRSLSMSWLILEALLALVIFVGIVWWTMFSGRPRGEVPPSEVGKAVSPAERASSGTKD